MNVRLWRFHLFRSQILPHWAGLLLAVALAAALRLVALDRFPPGLYHDEAFNGLDALRVLAGDRPVYFPANNGREPLYIYLIAPAIAWLGRTPGAVRLPAALAGTLTVAATYGLAGALFNRRVAFFTAMITATTLWHVLLSRQGFRAVLLPLLIALILWQGVRAWRSRRLGDWVLAGGLYGLSFYTYLAARLTPLPLLAFAVYLALTGRLHQNRAEARYWVARHWAGVLIAGAAALIVVMPLALYGLAHPELFFGRPMQVSIFNPAINGGDPLGLLVRQTWQSLLMFTTHGADEARHNVPGRPVFDPLIALAFLAGVALALSRIIGRQTADGGQPSTGLEPGSAVFRPPSAVVFVLIWTAGMLAPTVLSEGVPHFLRAVGVMPVVFILPALGLELVWKELATRFGCASASALVAALLIASSFLTLRDYFGPPYATSTALYDAFDGSAADMVLRLNRFLGAGWDGGLRVANLVPAPGRHVYIDRRLWAFSETVPFLSAVAPGAAGPLRFTEDRPIQVDPGPTLVLMVPGDTSGALAFLPVGARLQAEAGPMVGGIAGVKPFRLYFAYQAQPVAAMSSPSLARFAQPIDLLRASAQPEGPGALRVRLLWAARGPIADDYTVFVHAIANGTLIGQDDSYPSSGLLPTSWWRPGDQVDDERIVVAPGGLPPGWSVEVGLYRLDTLERVPVLGADGKPAGDKVQLP